MYIEIRFALPNTQSQCSAYSDSAFLMGYEERPFCVFKFLYIAGTYNNLNLNTVTSHSEF